MDSQPAQPTASPKIGFCPYCGSPVAEGFQFCGECGSQLPFKDKAAGPAPSLQLSQPQPPRPENFGSPQPQPEKILREIDLNPSQRKALKNASSTGLRAGAAITRLFGAVFGISAVASALFIGKNTTLDPTTFAETVLGFSMVALILSGISAGLRSRVPAIVRRRAFELTGVAKEATLGANSVVDVGGIKFLLIPKRALRFDALNKLVFATKGPVNNNRQDVLFLGANETDFKYAMPGIIVTSGYAGGKPSSWNLPRKGGRQRMYK